MRPEQIQRLAEHFNAFSYIKARDGREPEEYGAALRNLIRAVESDGVTVRFMLNQKKPARVEAFVTGLSDLRG